MQSSYPGGHGIVSHSSGPLMPYNWRPVRSDVLGVELPFAMDFLRLDQPELASAPPDRRPDDMPIARALSISVMQSPAADLTEVDWSKIQYDPVTQLTDATLSLQSTSCRVGGSDPKHSWRLKATPWGFVEKVEVSNEVEAYDDEIRAIDD